MINSYTLYYKTSEKMHLNYKIIEILYIKILYIKLFDYFSLAILKIDEQMNNKLTRAKN